MGALFVACLLSACGPEAAFKALPGMTRGLSPESETVSLPVPDLSENAAVEGAAEILPTSETVDEQPTLPTSEPMPASTPEPTPAPIVVPEEPVVPAPVTPAKGPCEGNESRANRICELVNKARSLHRLPPVILEPSLSRVASKYAAKMHRQGFFAHVSPEGSTLGGRLKESKFSYRYAGENIAKGHASSESVTRDWLRSPGHRANILEPRFQRMGLGRVGDVWVQLFTD